MSFWSVRNDWINEGTADVQRLFYVWWYLRIQSFQLTSVARIKPIEREYFIGRRYILQLLEVLGFSKERRFIRRILSILARFCRSDIDVLYLISHGRVGRTRDRDSRAQKSKGEGLFCRSFASFASSFLFPLALEGATEFITRRIYRGLNRGERNARRV